MHTCTHAQTHTYSHMRKAGTWMGSPKSLFISAHQESEVEGMGMIGNGNEGSKAGGWERDRQSQKR